MHMILRMLSPLDMYTEWYACFILPEAVVVPGWQQREPGGICMYVRVTTRFQERMP